MIRTTTLRIGSFAATCGGLLACCAGMAQSPQTPAGGQDTAKEKAQAPAAANTPAASELLAKTLTAYQNAKSYQGDWVYRTQQDGVTADKMIVELRSKGPIKLFFHLHAAADKTDNNTRPPSALQAVPEVRIVLDGKFAWFENVNEKVFYKVPLPKNIVSSPLMFFPQMATVGGAERGPDEKVGDRAVAVIFAKTKTGGLSRMEIDPVNFHIVRIASDETAGLTRTISTLAMEKEVFDGDIPDSVFGFKPGKGFKEIAAPSEAAALIGVDPAQKQDKGK